MMMRAAWMLMTGNMMKIRMMMMMIFTFARVAFSFVVEEIWIPSHSPARLWVIIVLIRIIIIISVMLVIMINVMIIVMIVIVINIITGQTIDHHHVIYDL